MHVTYLKLGGSGLSLADLDGTHERGIQAPRYDHMDAPQIVIVSGKDPREQVVRLASEPAGGTPAGPRSMLDVRNHAARDQPQRPYTGKRRACNCDDGRLPR